MGHFSNGLCRSLFIYGCLIYSAACPSGSSGKSKSSYVGEGAKSTDECFKCGKTGHWSSSACKTHFLPNLLQDTKKLQIVQDLGLQVIPRDRIQSQRLRLRGDGVVAVGVVGAEGKRNLRLPLQTTGDTQLDLLCFVFSVWLYSPQLQNCYKVLYSILIEFIFECKAGRFPNQHKQHSRRVSRRHRLELFRASTVYFSSAITSESVVAILAMHLYNITLQHATAMPQAIVGNFSGARQQEIIVSHGTRLELLRPDPQTGKVATVIATDVFGSIRSLAVFRLTGGTKGEILCVSSCYFSYPSFRLCHSRLGFWPDRYSGL